MTLDQILPADRILFDVEGGSKKRVLEFFSGFISQNIPSLDSQEVFTRLISRERLGSTGVGNGVAIPHARNSHCRQPLAGFMRLQQAVDFDAIDGEPVDLLFVLLVPETAEDTHLSLLAQIAEVMNAAETRHALRNAVDEQALHDILMQAISQLSTRV